jgi:hypothetical protein
MLGRNERSPAVSTSPTTLEHHDRRIALVGILALVVVAIGGAVLYVLADDPSPPASSSVEGSGVPTTETRSVTAFDGVELSGSNDVVIHVGETRSVRVSGDDNLVGRVTTEVLQGTLVVGTTPGSFTTQVPMRVEIGVPSLSALTLSGSGNVTIEGVAQPSFTVTLSGSGMVKASGAADDLAVTVSGSGEALLGDLVAKAVRAVVSGSGLIAVTATESLDAAVPGSGAIEYGGNPSSVTKDVSGSGAITPR